jgi:hypothetical protein
MVDDASLEGFFDVNNIRLLILVFDDIAGFAPLAISFTFISMRVAQKLESML